MRTYDVVVRAADGRGVAAALAEANNRDGVASEANEGVNGACDNTKKPKEGGEERVVRGLFTMS